MNSEQIEFSFNGNRYDRLSWWNEMNNWINSIKTESTEQTERENLKTRTFNKRKTLKAKQM